MLKAKDPTVPSFVRSHKIPMFQIRQDSRVSFLEIIDRVLDLRADFAGAVAANTTTRFQHHVHVLLYLVQDLGDELVYVLEGAVDQAVHVVAEIDGDAREEGAVCDSAAHGCNLSCVSAGAWDKNRRVSWLLFSWR